MARGHGAAELRRRGHPWRPWNRSRGASSWFDDRRILLGAGISGADLEVLSEPRYRAAAVDLQATIRASDGEVAVGELERLARPAS